MKDGQDVGKIELVVGNRVVGEHVSHDVSFIAPVPLYDGFIIYFFIPEECDPPTERDFTCTGSPPFSEDFRCVINGNRITI
jgi:hypothetical protein